MSAPHATLSAWTRDEHEGFYTAELHDWKLKVTWTPLRGGRGSFAWTAEREGIKTRKSGETYVELEHAMAEAEHFAHADAKRRTAAISARAEPRSAH